MLSKLEGHKKEISFKPIGRWVKRFLKIRVAMHRTKILLNATVPTLHIKAYITMNKHTKYRLLELERQGNGYFNLLYQVS